MTKPVKITAKKALKLINLGYEPVLLGSSGNSLKHPQIKSWQLGNVTPQEVASWQRGNIGIRCGAMREGVYSLIVFDFDYRASVIFPNWLTRLKDFYQLPLCVVTSGKGYHAYFLTHEAKHSTTLAGEYYLENGKRKLRKFIETIGEGKQVVSAGSLHPNGNRYQFHIGTYKNIPLLTPQQYEAICLLSQDYDQRKKQPKPQPTVAKQSHPKPFKSGVCYKNALDYAYREIATAQGDIKQEETCYRLLGYGGLTFTLDGEMWYCHSDDTGGVLHDLIAWYTGQSISQVKSKIKEGYIAKGARVRARLGQREIVGVVDMVRNSYGQDSSQWESRINGIWVANNLCEVLHV